MKYHINAETGNVGPCSASKRACPHGGPADHFNSMQEAQAAYEQRQFSSFSQPVIINGYERPELSYVDAASTGTLAEVKYNDDLDFADDNTVTNCLDCGNSLTEEEIRWEIEYCPRCAGVPDDTLGEDEQDFGPLQMRDEAIAVSEQDKAKERFDRAVSRLNELGDDLEGSVPDPENYRAAAKELATFGDEHGETETVTLAREWSKTGDAYEMLVADEFLRNVGQDERTLREAAAHEEREVFIQQASRLQDVDEDLDEQTKQALNIGLVQLNSVFWRSPEQDRQKQEIEFILKEQSMKDKTVLDRSVAESLIDKATAQMARNETPTAQERGELYALLSNFDGIGTDHNFMAADPEAKAQLAEQLRAVLRVHEEDAQIRADRNRWLNP